MKKTISMFLSIILLSFVFVNLHASARKSVTQWLHEIPSGQRLYVNWGRYVGDDSTNYEIDVSTSLNISGDLTVSGSIGDLRTVQYWTDIATAANDVYISTFVYTMLITDLITNGTTYALADSEYSDVITPRNVVAVLLSTSATSGSMEAVGSITITGKDSNNRAQEEVLVLSTNSVTGAVPFCTITSFEVTVSTVNWAATYAGTEIVARIGSGNVIGIANDISTTADVYKVLEAGAVSTSYTANATYDSIDFSADPNASRDYEAWYQYTGN